jgi:acetylornithine/N-succinyldiaminopimelate aminotransferase
MYDYNKYLLNVYSRLPIDFTHGQGAWLFDQNSKRYLDLISGLGVSILGHNHPAIISTIYQQASKLIHSSNIVQINQQGYLAKLLVELFERPAKVFFNNSGAEAIETALKLIRLYANNKNINNPKIIVMERAYHGRTIATLSASDNKDIQQGFEPLLECFIRVPLNDITAIHNLTTSPNANNIVAVLLEPIQGEGGIRIADPNYLTAIREICTANDWIMVLDEIQSSLGRTGKFFCFQHYNIKPDVVTIAKGLANGVPIGACIISEPLAELFKPKSHGSTFGGNPLACSTAITTIETILNNNLYKQIIINGEYFLQNLKIKLANNKNIIDIRGKGLMIGIELNIPCQELVAIALNEGLFINVTRQYIIRLLPPLIIEKSEIDYALEKLVLVINKFCNNK